MRLYISGVLLLITGSVLLAMVFLANTTFPKPANISSGREICDGRDRIERCAEEYVLGPKTVGNNTWVDHFQRHQWPFLAGTAAAVVSLYCFGQIARKARLDKEDQQARINELRSK